MGLSIFLALLYSVTNLRVVALQVAPTWTTSSLVQAGEKNVIATKSNKNTIPIPSATMTFAFAFSSVPHLAYGMPAYEGNDGFGEEYFEVYRTSLTASSFSVKVQITGVTNVWLIAVRYIVIDSAFPHHLNSFDNVPVNYGNGALRNITVSSKSETSYTNRINYTNQAIAKGYSKNKFFAPYSNYKFLLFITSLFIDGDRQAAGDPNRPLNLRVRTNVQSTSIYSLYVAVKIQAKVSKLHFSMLIYDKADVEASRKYVLVNLQVNYTKSGGSTPVPRQFQTNLIMGLTQYSSSKTASCLHYNLRLVFSATIPTMSVSMPASVPRADIPFTRFGFTIFYLKTWVCQNGTFFNTAMDVCVSCPVPNCVSCTYIDLCNKCNSSGGYLLDATASPDKQCTPCPVPNCLNCSNATFCLGCNETGNYFLDPMISGKCILCSIPYCLNCQNLTVCSICDQRNNYFLNPSPTEVSDQCIACSIQNCLLCSSLETCIQCNETNNYFLNVNSTTIQDACIVCQIPNCIKCLSLTECSVCNTTEGYFVNPVDKQCMLCPIPYCLECRNSTDCIVCETSQNYFLETIGNNSGLCVLCDLPHCYKCANLTDCSVCQQFDNYFLNPSRTSPTDQCIQCNVPECIICTSLTTCNTCNTSNKFYLNPNATTSLEQCLPCSIPFCVECGNLTDCILCDSNLSYFYNPNFTSIADMCLLCTLSECVECSNLLECLICNQTNNYFLNISDLLCYFCNISNCIQCNTLTTCRICDTANLFFLNPATGQCMTVLPICGDNICLPSQACDDGNNENNDGCSSLCTVEADFVCEPNIFPGFFNSICYFVGYITIRVAYIEKVDTANQIEILLELGPANLAFWEFVDFAMMVSLSNATGFDSYSVRRNIDGTVSIIANYNTDIHNMEITVNVEPARSGQIKLSRALPAERTFPAVPTDNEAAIFYNQSVYDMAKVISMLADVVAALSLLLFLISIFARKLIGLQMIAVVQISYLSLLSLSSMNPCFRALANIWFVNGFSYFSLSKGYLLDPHTPLSVKGIFLYSRFLENYNCNFLLIIIPCLISLICLILAKTVFKFDNKRSQRIIQAARICACQTAFNGIMFSGYIVAVALALQVQFGARNMEGVIGVVSIAEACVFILLFAIYFFLLIKVPKYFGEFVNSFIKLKELSAFHNIKSIKCNSTSPSNKTNSLVEDQHKNTNLNKENIPKPQSERELIANSYSLNSKIKKKWYNFLIIERLGVGIGLVLLLPLEGTIYYLISIFTVQLLVVIVWRPYSRTAHNVRFVMNMLVCIVVQIILKLSLDNQSTIKQMGQFVALFPLLIVLLLLGCIIYNLVFFIHDIYLKSKQNRDQKQRKQKEIENETFRLLAQSTFNNKSPLSPNKQSAVNLISLQNSSNEKTQNNKQYLQSIRQKVKAESSIVERKRREKGLVLCMDTLASEVQQDYKAI